LNYRTTPDRILKYIFRTASGAAGKLVNLFNRDKTGKFDTGRFTCAFIIRLHYPENDPRFEWRLKYFKEAVLPRIRAQSDQKFDICVRCNPAHDRIFENLGCKPFHVKNEYSEYVLSEDGTRKFFYDFVKWEDCIGLERYDIQVGLDSDDLIALDYIKRIKLECAGSSSSLHIYFQPEEFVLETRKFRSHPERFMDGSAFFALYFPDKSVYHHCFETSHRKVSKLADRSVRIPSGYCWITIHDLNESSGREFRAEDLKGAKPWAERPWSNL
jgi:hypothetical protein